MGDDYYKSYKVSVSMKLRRFVARAHDLVLDQEKRFLERTFPTGRETFVCPRTGFIVRRNSCFIDCSNFAEILFRFLNEEIPTRLPKVDLSGWPAYHAEHATMVAISCFPPVKRRKRGLARTLRMALKAEGKFAEARMV